MNSQKRVVLTGPSIFTRPTISWLKKIFQLTIIDYDLSETELAAVIQSLQPVEGLIHGGSTFISEVFFKRIPEIKWNIFPGMEPFPIYNRSALDCAREHNIPIFPTGGGLRAVAETTCQEISDPFLIRKRATGRNIEVPYHTADYHLFETLAIIGSGHLASEIFARCPHLKKFERLCHSGRSEKPDFTSKTGAPFRHMEDAFSSSIVVLTIAHIPGITDNYVDLNLLRLIPHHGLVINNVRPQIMNIPETLRFALERRDVTIIIDASNLEIKQEYGLEILNELVALGNIILTGHTAWKKPSTRKEYSAGLRRIISEKNLA